jgi:hypothetical protein
MIRSFPPVPAIGIFLLLIAAPFLFSQAGGSAILTSAAGGVFSTEQKLGFSLAAPGRLRITVNGGEVYNGEGPYFLELPVVSGEPKDYTVRAEYSGPPPENILLETRSWHIRLDPKTVYAASPDFSPHRAGAPGGKENPFPSLEEAVDYVRDREMGSVMITGSMRLENPLRISRPIRISGSPDGTGASIFFGPGACIQVDPSPEGVEKVFLELRDLALERPAGGLPLISLGTGSVLEISGLEILEAGPLISSEERSVCRITDTRGSIISAGDERSPAFRFRGGQTDIRRSSFDLNGTYALLFDIEGGNFKAQDSGFRAAAQKTAAVLVLKGAKAEIRNTLVSASAADYASAAEAAASELLIYGGELETAARDGVGALLDTTEALFIDAAFTVKTSFLARAVEIRGLFPSVTGCYFAYRGQTRRSEVFAVYGAELPSPGTIGGSRFDGFSHILGNAWPVENTGGFNRAFAPSERPNSPATGP